MPKKLCRCGSGLERYELVDARGIFCCFVCEKCEEYMRRRYRSDIFKYSDYWTHEPVDSD